MNCAFCTHPLEIHCPGEVPHTDHKEDSRMVPVEWRRGTHVCHTRHCLAPLCCCVDFKEAAQTAKEK